MDNGAGSLGRRPSGSRGQKMAARRREDGPAIQGNEQETEVASLLLGVGQTVQIPMFAEI